MRFDTPAYFYEDPTREYDTTTGDYIEKEPEKLKAWCSVTDSSANAKAIMYGNIAVDSLTLRSRTETTKPRVIVKDKIYNVDYHRRLNHLSTYIVSEVQ